MSHEQRAATDAVLTTRRRLLLGGGAVLALGACGRPAPRGELRITGMSMASSYTVKLAQAAGMDADAAAAAVQAAFDEVDARMSLYKPTSELTRLNRQPAGAPLALSPALYGVLAAAQEVSAASGGAFDVTVAPLVQAWGFGTEKRRDVPPAAQVSAGRAAVDWRALRLDGQRQTATKAHAPLHADLGGIAKGYGVDRAAHALDAISLTHFMVELGGEVRTRGRNAAGEPWQIGIEQPDAMPQRARWVVPLDGLSMATSGDYRIYFEAGGVRYSHEIDPRSAAPIAHRLCSVTVADADCLRADALATALIVMGPERGFALAQALGIAALFIERESVGRYIDRSTTAFAALGPRRIG